MAEGENILQEAETSVKKLPPWAIVAGVVVLGGVAYLLIFRGSGSKSSPTSGILPDIGGSGAGGTDTSTINNPVVPAATSNNSWLTNAVQAVSQATGIDPYLVNVYLTQYLAGTSPSSNAGAYTQFQKAINSALQLFGAPPVPITSNPTSGSFFTSASDWLSAGLSDLGASNYNASYAQEISDFLSGKTTSLSQGAANLYQQIAGNLGNAPGAGVYSITSTTTTPPPASAITMSMVVGWQNLYNSLVASAPGGQSNVTASTAFNYWKSAIQQTIPSLSGLTDVQLANAFNLINQSLAMPNSPFRDNTYTLSWFNSLLTNPSILGSTAPTLLYLYTGSPTTSTSLYGQLPTGALPAGGKSGFGN